jgi:hypothetical protein
LKSDYDVFIFFVYFCRDKPKRKREVGEPEQQNVPSSASAEGEDPLKEYVGTGRITSSDTTVHGHYTEFTQLKPGDAIIITHPVTYDHLIVTHLCVFSFY